ncbi:hypothetical protein FQA47_022910 [Oryzias melastigma]|uniref:Uncharacterized protein n=1 Tax=Oryzias melastigma TaxID=30732 RepID=A0A834C4T0_ORYME|nr:hypothetical protein FQA47_022910 [Oryzias melastigma]
MCECLLLSPSALSFPSQNPAFPEKSHAGGALPPRQRHARLRPDDSRLLQHLSSAGNDKKGKPGGGASSWSDRHRFFLPQRTVRMTAAMFSPGDITQHHRMIIETLFSCGLIQNMSLLPETDSTTTVTVITKSFCLLHCNKTESKSIDQI